MIKDLKFVQGKTFQLVARWETEPFIYKPITGVAQSAPARITCPTHAIPDGWRVAVVSVKGMKQINASPALSAKDFNPVSVIDANTVDINAINSADFTPYVSGGYLQFYTPASLSGFTARMQIKDKVGGVVLASTEAGDTPLNIITVTVDNALKTITIVVSATATAALTWVKGVYDLELSSVAGVVTALLSGNITVSKEVTT